MNDKQPYIFKTNYFYRPWTWINRVLVFLFLIIAMLTFELSYHGWYLWKGLFLIVCGLYILLKPKDDLAVKNRHLYHFENSLVPFLSRTKIYDIAEIRSIKVGGIYSSEFEVMDFLGNGFSNRLEIIFEDDSSKTLNLRIYKKDLTFVVSLVSKVKAAYKRR